VAPAVALGLGLALFSAFTSAFAHATLKSGINKLAVITWIRLCEFVVALPLVFIVGLPPASLWFWLIAAVAIHAAYQLVLSVSYALSDFTAAYPIARGFVPVFTAILGIAFLGDRLDGIALIGVATVSAGILCLAGGRSITRGGFIAAATAGLFTTAYTLVDAKGVRAAPDMLTFVAWFLLLGALPMPAVLFARYRGAALGLLVEDRKAGVLAGILAIISFVPALFALGLAPVGAVAALRESSVIIGLLLGAVLLKERLGWRRLSGSLLVTAGTIGVIVRAAFV
jgi:drug/metabolite transporter (DMT)-like permease